MLGTLSPQEFVTKWRGSALTERSAAQQHFLDICRLVGHPAPAEVDPTGESFTFERGASKQAGGHPAKGGTSQGWADVWKKGCFGWEYKGKHKDLDVAYQQLLQYRESLENPPLLVVCDFERIVVHTNFTNTIKRVVTITLDDLNTVEGLGRLRNVFYSQDAFRVDRTPDQVTQEAAAQFAQLADRLRQYGHKPQRIATFLIRLLFCLFAEDTGLLPDGLFSRLLAQARGRSKAFGDQLHQLFRAMADGGWFGADEIAQFDGRLFDDDAILELDGDGLRILGRVTALDWSSIEPSILGTLFQRSLDPAKRAQLGAHYTSKEDILLVVEAVVMAPLRRRWAVVQAQARDLAARRDAARGARRTKLHGELTALLTGFAGEIAALAVLDPATGSGNFLYVTLKQLLDLEKEVIALAGDLGVGRFFPSVSPGQLHGIEIDEYAHELAQATIWIGYIQWLRENGFGVPSDPILKPLDNIRLMDAILAHDGAGGLVEPEWPAVDAIVSNPPFLGGKRLRTELGDRYVEDLFRLYEGRVPREADLVCYWFERARAMIESGKLKRCGLLATQGIRGGANRRVLERIKETGGIFWAQSDRDWVLEGAAVHVSMIGFDDGSEVSPVLDGRPVPAIHANLTGSADLTRAARLPENAGLSFMGDTKGGAFDIGPELAVRMLAAPLNPNGRPNKDVLRPWINGMDVTGRPRGMWIIDFGVDMPEAAAALYETPFEYALEHIKPARVSSRTTRAEWWLHERPRPEMRAAIAPLRRFIATPTLSKHRLFVWVDGSTLPDHQVIVFARDDDYFFGILHSRVHEVWARGQGTQLREVESGFRYTPSTTFETFPFPWPPGREPAGDSRVEAIARAARELADQRDRWLNPEGAGEAELKRRTLTNLYNERPAWLTLAHRRLDDAVLAAYNWPGDVSDDDILARLLELNGERVRQT